MESIFNLEAALSQPPAFLEQLPAHPVRLYCAGEDPCVRVLRVMCQDQVGLLFKLCDLLTGHGLDISCAEIDVRDGLLDNRFELRTSRPADVTDAADWCKELEEFLRRNHKSEGAALRNNIAAVSKRLSVNPDLLSVVSFYQLFHDGHPDELRYKLELEGINQAGLLTYASFVLYRCGFSVVCARISTCEGHVLDSFELSTTSAEAEHLLKTHMDVPTHVTGKDIVPLPFHATRSDVNLEALMEQWSADGTGQLMLCSPHSSPSCSPRASRAPSLDGLTNIECAMATAQHQQQQRRSRFPSHFSELEEPSPRAVRKDSWDMDQHPCATASETMGRTGPGVARKKSPGKKTQRQMSVSFTNGDLYTGGCILVEGGERRHGFGTYTYSAGTHDTYKQYRGQWREDKKHGFGVLFYRNGGVYVGQWETNQKHGLGVLLENSGDGTGDAACMPAYRYEGQWCKDEMHGLGAEEGERSSYFGHFERGKRSGRGVRMNLSDTGATGCEVVDDSGVRTSLLDFLEAEMASQWLRAEVASSSGFRHGDDRSGSATIHCCMAEVRPGISDVFDAVRVVRQRVSSPTLTSENDSHSQGSSGKTSDRTPSVKMGQSAGGRTSGAPWCRSVSEFTSPISDTAQTPLPMITTGRKNSRSTPSEDGRAPAHGPAAHAGCPVSAETVCGGVGSSSSAAAAPAGSLAAAGAGNTLAVASASVSAIAAGGGGSGNTAAPPPVAAIGAPVVPGQGACSGCGAVPDAHARTSLPVRRRPATELEAEESGTLDGVDSSVVFSLWEENNLLSPRHTTLDSSIPEESVQRQRDIDSRTTIEDPDLFRKVGEKTEARSASVVAEPKASPRALRQSVSDPCPESLMAELVACGRGNSVATATCAAATLSSSSGSNGSRPAGAAHGELQASPRRHSTSASICAKDGRGRRRVRSPMLWGEDELSAFIACLGIRAEVCQKVQQHKLKGVVRFLELSNSDMRRKFGLRTPVERLVVRSSLKRLLDADRWENNVRGHKVGDILRDSVLGNSSIPMEDLRLVAQISQGGYGTVYRGMLQSSDKSERPKPVAVKEMKGERRVRLYELLKEACVMASLNHPNICTFLGVCTDASARKCYIVSELMDCSLFDLIHQPYKLRWHGELTVALVIDISRGICAGTVYLHAKNLVHADLKSSNILIDYSSSWQLVPRICDFGHAAVRTFPAPHHRCGTPHWAAPEVLRSEALSTSADVYSIGVIMWEMLTQRLPHKGLSFGQVLASVGWAGWSPELSLLPAVPAEFRRLLRECLRFVPADRPTSKEIQRRLRRIPKQAKLTALAMLGSFASFFCST